MRLLILLLSCLPMLLNAQERVYVIREATELLEAHIDLTGGETNWREVERVRWEASVSGVVNSQPIKGKRTAISQYPGFRYVENNLVNGTANERYKVVFTPTKAWMETPTDRKIIPIEDGPSLQGAKEELVILDSDEYEMIEFKKTRLNNRLVYEVTLEKNGKTLLRYYDRTTLMLIATQVTLDDGRIIMTRYSDFRPVGKLIYPFHVEVYSSDLEGKQVYDINRIELNPKIDAARLFSFKTN